MTSERTEETEALYAQGIALFRTAQWSEAVQVFSNLRAISSAYPEIDTLIADALLKIEIERTQMPEVALPPRRIPAWLIGAATLALLFAGSAAAALRPAPPQPSQASASVVPAVAEPTQAPRPTALPPEPTTAPTAQLETTSAPAQTSEPAAAVQPGTLVVRMADGQPLTRTIGNAVALSYRVLDAQGAEIYRGALGSAAALPPGRYAIEISGAASVALGDVDVRPGASTTVEVREQGGGLRAVVIP